MFRNFRYFFALLLIVAVLASATAVLAQGSSGESDDTAAVSYTTDPHKAATWAAKAEFYLMQQAWLRLYERAAREQAYWEAVADYWQR